MYIKLANYETETVYKNIISDESLLDSFCDMSESIKDLPEKESILLKKIKDHFFGKFYGEFDSFKETVGNAFLEKVDWKSITYFASTHRQTKDLLENSKNIILSRSTDGNYNTIFKTQDDVLIVYNDRLGEFLEDNKNKTIQLYGHNDVNISFPDGMNCAITSYYSGQIHSLRNYYYKKNIINEKEYNETVLHCLNGPACVSRLRNKYEFDFVINGQYLDKQDSRKCAKLFLKGTYDELVKFMEIIQFKYCLEEGTRRRPTSSFRCCGHKINCHD